MVSLLFATRRRGGFNLLNAGHRGRHRALDDIARGTPLREPKWRLARSIALYYL